MKDSLSIRVLFGSMFSALILSAILSFPASAEGGEPPSDPVPTEEPRPAGEVVSSTEEDLSGTGGTLEDESAVAEETESPGGAELSVMSETDNDAVLAVDLPEDTGLIIVGEGGEPLPLASEEAAEMIEIIDPRWCPAGVTPGGASCTGPYESLEQLISAITEGDISEPSANGVIWIQGGDDTSTAGILIDGNALHFTNWAKYTLTLKGGWSGGNNASVNISNPSIFDQSISIINWANDVTLSDITFDGAGLEIATSGKVSLTRVNVKNGSGAEVDNDAGTKDVLITSSEFSDNSGAGLIVSTKGMITLGNVSAINNSADGANLNNSGGAKPVTLTGTNIFSENDGSGLVVHSKGAITINNLIADANGGYGADLENELATTAQPVSLTYYNEFKFNGLGGLSINTVGAVTLNKITATHNGGDGVFIDNAGAFYANVTINGVNQFNNNGRDGLDVTSSGNITLNNVTANNNGQSELFGSGAILNNSGTGIPKTVLLKGTNTFRFNFDAGLTIDSYGAISVANLTARGNENGSGLVLNNRVSAANQQNVTLTGFTIADDNGDVGVQISSYGNISAAKVTASGNGGAGLLVKNNGGTLPKNVSLSGGTTLNENGGNGLTVESAGAITLAGLQANFNNGTGASLNNSFGMAAVTLKGVNGFSGNLGGGGLDVSSKGSITLYNFKANENLGGGGVYLNNAFPGMAGNVNIITSVSNWCNEADRNTGSGIKILSRGSVSLSNLCAEGNGSIATPGYGAEIDNHSALGFKPVTLSGNNSFTRNYTGGIRIWSSGSIMVKNVTGSQSVNGFGAEFNNTYSGVISPQTISIAGTNHFSANFGNGLTVLSYGAIAGNNLTANSNGANNGSGFGARIDNCGAVDGACTVSVAKPITLTGGNTFNSNSQYGLTISSLGAINANKLEAGSNDETGAVINNNYPGAVAGITVTGFAIFDDNDANGLELTSRGAVSLSNLHASWNGGYGANLSNLDAPFPKGITFGGANVFENNTGYGLLIKSLGTITVNNLAASYNVGYGAKLDNAQPGATGGIILKGTQNLQGNHENGLELDSNRAITINSVNSSSNFEYGVRIDNGGSGLPFDVKLSGTNTLNENGETGLEVTTLGAIFLNNVMANGNGQAVEAEFGYGVDLDNQTGASIAKPITITGVNAFNDNLLDGLHALSLATIKANSLAAEGNMGDGVYLDNTLGTSSAAILLTGSNLFEANTGFGLTVLSRGAISVSNVYAVHNLGGGAKLENQTSDSAVPVFITGFNIFSDNGGEEIDYGPGLKVTSRGNISLSNVIADGNSSYGAKLDNFTFAIGAPTVTVTGINSFSGNDNSGLNIKSAGDVAVTRVTADQNIGEGGSIGSLRNVTLTCGSMINNDGRGLFVSAVNGTVTLKGVFAYGNEFGNSKVSAAHEITVRTCPIP